MLRTLSRWFLYASIFSVVVVLTGTFFPFIGGKYYFFRTMIGLSAIAWLLWWAFEDKKKEAEAAMKDLISRPLFFAVSLFVLMFLLAALFAFDVHGAFWSNFERGEGAFQMLHYYAFFVLAILNLRKKEDWIVALKLFLVAAGLMILYGVVGFFFLYNPGWFCLQDAQGQIVSCNGIVGRMITPYQTTSAEGIPKTLFGIFTGTRFQGSLGNPAYVAPYLMFSMAYAFLLWSLGRLKNKYFEAGIYGGLVFIFLIFFILSQTRGAFLGLLAAVFSFLIYMAITHRPTRKWFAGILVLGALGLGLLFSFRESPMISKLPVSRLFEISFSERTAQTRLWTWNSAWQGFKERPLLGWGPENFSMVFDRHFDEKHFIPGDPSAETWFDRAHSIIFDYLAETGLLGLLSFFGMFLVFYLQFFRSRLLEKFGFSKVEGKDFHLSPWAWGLVAVVPIGYFVQGLVLFDVLPIYINVFFFLALMSFVFKSSGEPTHTHHG